MWFCVAGASESENSQQIFEDRAKMDQISSCYDCCVTTTAAVRWVILPTHHPRSHPFSLIFKLSVFDFNLFYEILHTPAQMSEPPLQSLTNEYPHILTAACSTSVSTFTAHFNADFRFMSPGLQTTNSSSLRKKMLIGFKCIGSLGLLALSWRTNTQTLLTPTIINFPT